ncbi:MAG TPA: alkaline phosphatase family protein [Flavobacteriales bacterium]|nr:alkaline phosphatase family protein [Flavobacteriales bacterium]
MNRILRITGSMFMPRFIGVARAWPLVFFFLATIRTEAQSGKLPVAVPLAEMIPKPAWTTPPKLVVGIVVDQMRTDYIYRYWDNFSTGGFKRLIGEGAFLRDMHYNYAPTHTGPGHASIYTGTTPHDHGIVANDMFIRSTGKGLNCVQDDATSGVGAEGPRAQRSPVNLRSSTLADEMERRYEGRSKTIGVAWKDRAAILPIGRTGDAAYWNFEDAEGRFATSRWYMESLPDWLVRFNARRLPAEYLKGTWDLLLPRERYHQSMPDDNPYEELLPGVEHPVLPLDLARAFAASGNNMGLLKTVPAGLTLVTELAMAALEGEGMGRDEVPDLLSVSYGGTDEIGHATGPLSLEVEDMYLRLDRELERLLTGLDERIGQGGYTVFLTADHAGGDVPEYLKSRKASAGYVEMAELSAAVDAALMQRFGTGKWVRKRVKEQFFLNDSLILANKLDRAQVQDVAAAAVRAFPGVADAYTAENLVRGTRLAGRAALVQRGFFFERSGDVAFILRPGYLSAWPGMARQGADHGSVWNYDTHVPTIFFGHGVVKGDVVRRTSITDIVPTICMILGCSLPDAAIGEPVREVLQR